MSSADSSPAPLDNAVSSPAPPETKIKLPGPQTKRWADEKDDPVEDSKPSSSTPALESIVEDLKIDENKKINELVDEPEDSNFKAVTSGETPYSWASSFEDLKLSAELLKGLYVEMKFQKPSKIQAVGLPMILTPPYKDLIAQGHNGSGKSTCLVLGMLSRVDPNLKAPQALCICPTRELAMQNWEVLRKMGKHIGITSKCAVPMDTFTNYKPIEKPAPVLAQIVVGTPATIKRWMSRKDLAVTNVKILVFDEADQMLAVDGFKDESLRIKKDIDKSSCHCQVLLFSATFNETVKNFVAKIVKYNNGLPVKKEELCLASVKQDVYCPDENTKIQIIKDRIFDASKLHKQLVDGGYTVTSIQGAINPEDRHKIVKEFSDELNQVLVTTDLLARGFNQQEVNLVITYFLPAKYDTEELDYEVHRKKSYNQLFVKKEELSLASVKQDKVFCPDENGKIQLGERFLDQGEHFTLGQTECSDRKLHKQLVDDGSTSVRCGHKEANRVNHNDVLEKLRTSEDENLNWEKKPAIVEKELEDTLREVRKHIKRACAVKIEETKRAVSTELEDLESKLSLAW